MVFSRKKIGSDSESLFDKLKNARQGKKISIEDVSLKTGINPKYLKALEDNDEKNLPEGVYYRTILKKYCEFLGLRRELENFEYKKTGEKVDIFKRKTIKKSSFLVFTKLLRSILTFSILLIVFLYLGFYLKNSLSKPVLQIFEPTQDIITENNFIHISGQAEERTQVEINDKLILKDANGFFKELVELKKGLNTITISAKNRYSKKNTITRQVLVK